jgi:large subunit ribosomal protein L4
MSSLTMRDGNGADAGTVDLPDAVFGIEPNVSVMHQVVTAQLAAARAGTHSTKTRAEVRGGGTKPWRQKGTGRARQGSIRAVQWRGGGVAHGPKPRDYRQRTPKKMVSLALRSALSDRQALGKVVVVTAWPMTEPRTKDAIATLEALGLRTTGERPERVLLVLDRAEDAVWKSFRNLGERVQIILTEELNTYDVLVNDVIVFSRSTLESLVGRFGSVSAATEAAEPTASSAPSAETAGESDDDGGAE